MSVLIEYKDIVITYENALLTLRNQTLSRVLDLSCGAPRTVSLQDARQNQFAAENKEEADISFIGLHRPMHSKGIWQVTDVSAKVHQADLWDGERVIVTIVMHEILGDTWYRREYFLYPDLAVIAVQNFIRSAVTPLIYWTRRKKLDGITEIPSVETESCADGIAMESGMIARKAVMFHGRTDFTDDLVEETDCMDTEFLQGNLLFCQDEEKDCGLFFLQEAPPSNERRDMEQYDFRITRNNIYSCCWGIDPSELNSWQEFRGYRHILGIFHDDVERDCVLKEYLKRRFPFDFAKNATVMVNPWGCGHFPEVASEEFIMRDMEAGAESGATHYQIDDGWQSGGGLAELAVKNRKATCDFWKISDRFTNHSFEAIAQFGKKCGIEPALWLAPSANCEYEDRNDFADMILQFHKQYGIRFFKIDNVRIRSYRAEQNLRNLLTKVRQESGGEVVFNLDTTNGQRPGYFHFLEFGNIFLENRYTCHMWGLGYHPEKVLHTLWMLSQYMNPYMLQIEIPNPDNVCSEFYEKYPYGDPRIYSLEYAAMLSMFASPLLWFTPSDLSKENRQILRHVMNLHKIHRQAIADGIVFTVGKEPDGHSFSGFQSHDFKTNSGYLLVFREKGCVSDSDILTLKKMSHEIQWEYLTGHGNTESAGHGAFRITIPDCPGFLMLKYSAAANEN